MKKLVNVAVLLGAALLVSCGQDGATLPMGDKSKMDTLSYAVGANIATGVNYQMSDIPFDVATVCKGLEQAATGKSKVEHEKAVESLREYFMNKRDSLAEAIAEKRAAADSARLAQGDSTRVEYPEADEAMFETEKQRDELSYALGVDLGTNLVGSKMPLQVYWVTKGISDVFAKQPQMQEMEVMQYLQKYFTVTVPAQNAEASAEWLQKMEKKSGVEKTESGLLYKVVEMGDETVRAINDQDEVTVHYTGRLRTGEVFDSSIFENLSKEDQEARKMYNPAFVEGQNTPATFALNRVIKGWTEGMKLIGKGGKIILYIPSELAYGQNGIPRGPIGPNEALEFEVELLDVKPYVAPTVEPTEEKAAE